MSNGRQKYGKRDAEREEVLRQFEEAKRRGEQERMNQVRCRSCKEARKPIYIEMGGFIFCGDCIEAAAKIVAEQKAR